MAKHEFGIMPSAPEKGVRYEEYEPYKFDCISVDDVYLENIVSRFNNINFYWHSLDVPGKGLAYWGITLIPPMSIPDCINIIENINELSELKNIMHRAYSEQKWIIHYGI